MIKYFITIKDIKISLYRQSKNVRTDIGEIEIKNVNLMKKYLKEEQFLQGDKGTKFLE